ncbi:hypothetical protein [Calothrix sp. UHCC 0171]|uniref:hypothetical protein n=1 Tax=Calothrix sp. UHCC 0171 TaxID=3110245 RepID=UPI002B1FE68F|nr:hypothetical protein [Calothrix sp. UHCC 0171]MEA5574459.1 hypothetical protein [Calothrix sp. UHCC 0171]
MTASNIRQKISEYVEVLPPEQVKTLLLAWLTSSSGNLEDFEQLLTNQPTQTIEESLEFGEIEANLDFQPLTETEMVQQSKLALEAYRRKGSGVAHNVVREWAETLGTDEEQPCPR